MSHFSSFLASFAIHYIALCNICRLSVGNATLCTCRHPGETTLVAQMEKQGFGNTVKSWVGTGANAPITPEQVHAAFGPEAIASAAAKFGLNPQELAQKLSQVLPQAIDHLTPAGTVKPS
jgi:uncharacterized protein YidB (DUF937 family)